MKAPPTDPVMYTALTFKMNLQLEYQMDLSSVTKYQNNEA